MYLCLNIYIKKLQCDEQHIEHNKFLAHCLDLLRHLLNYGYYKYHYKDGCYTDNYKDIDEVLNLVINLLDGKSDSPGQDKSGKLIIAYTFCIYIIVVQIILQRKL